MGIGRIVKGYFDLCRISNLPSVWSNVLCATLLATDRFSWGEYLLPAVALSCYYLAGMCLNDVCDVACDAVQRPSRPIPSGRISRTDALLFTILLFASGTLVLLHAPSSQGLYAAILLVGLIVWYDFHHKLNPFSVLLMASCRFLVFAVASLALTGAMSRGVIVAGGVQFAYVVCLSLVARYENSRPMPFPVIPFLLSGICLLDGMILAVMVRPGWLAAGFGGMLLVLIGQRFVRGD